MVDKVAKFSVKIVYGKERFYPENDTARDFLEVSGSATLSREKLALIQRLGFTVELVSVVLPVAG